MELSQEFLMDMVINAGGYLLAGIISVLFYIMIQKKKSPVTFDEVLSETTTDNQPIEKNVELESQEDRKVEFITFKRDQIQNQNILEEQTIKLEKVQENNSGRMSRKEAINLAKKMLLAGATNDKIKRILPVSESELALLNLNIK